MTYLLALIREGYRVRQSRQPLTQPSTTPIQHPAMNKTITILPTIHSNGSSAKSLTVDYSRARRAVQEAMIALMSVDFNARDYYVQGPTAWTQAVSQRHDIYQHLSDILDALHEHEMHCSQFIK